MFKKLQKTFAIFLVLIMLMATVCFAENSETTVTSEAPEATDIPTESVEKTSEDSAEDTTPVVTTGSNEGSSNEEEEMLKSDLYLIESTVQYSRIVDGNAYIIGNDISFSSVVGGDVFILGNNVNITEDALIYGNLYVLGNNVTLDGFVYGGDLYAACSVLTIGDTGAVNRDAKISANKITFNGGTGRNVFLAASELEVAENAQVYGDFNYSSGSAIQIPSGVVKGNINYSEFKINDNEDTNPVLSYIMDALFSLVYTLAILGVIILVAPRFLSKLENTKLKQILPACGIGLATLVLPIIIAILLLITVLGVPISFVLIAVWALLVFCFAIPIATIAIAGFIANKFKFFKKAHNLLAVILSSIIVWALGLIPYVGGLITFVITLIGLGLIIINIWNGRKNKIEE